MKTTYPLLALLLAHALSSVSHAEIERRKATFEIPGGTARVANAFDSTDDIFVPLAASTWTYTFVVDQERGRIWTQELETSIAGEHSTPLSTVSVIGTLSAAPNGLPTRTSGLGLDFGYQVFARGSVTTAAELGSLSETAENEISYRRNNFNSRLSIVVDRNSNISVNVPPWGPHFVFTPNNSDIAVRSVSFAEGRYQGTSTAIIPGDANEDGKVAFDDFLVLSNSFDNPRGPNGTFLWSEGDFNYDNLVGFNDFLVLSTNFGTTSDTATAVPEPTGSAWWAVAGLILGVGRRTRRSLIDY